MIDLLGVVIHDPDVAFTDLGLAVLGGFFAVRLGKSPGGVFMAGLASAAFWGAVFHGLFPAGTGTTAGFAVWIGVALSIAVVAAVLVGLSLKTLAPRLSGAGFRSILAVYVASFVVTVILVDESFGTIVKFYGPALGLFLVVAVWRFVTSRSPGWALIVAGLVTSVVAALIQQMRISLHPVYFDHNAVYHVVQGGALVLLYQGFRGVEGVKGRAEASGSENAFLPHSGS